MKEWLTAGEIAGEELLGLPRTERSIQRIASQDEWDSHPAYSRERSGRGGGMEFHFRLLPPIAQIAYYQKHVTIGADAGEVIEQDAPEHLTDRAAKERDARLAIVSAFQRFSAGLKLGHASCRKIFCDKYLLGSISVDPWVKETIRSISMRSLSRWVAIKKSGKINDLAVDRGQSRKSTGLLDTASGGQVKTFILALIAHNPHMKAERVRTQCQAKFGDEIATVQGKLKALPPIRTFQHAIKGWRTEESVVLTKLSNPDKYRSTLAPSGVGTLRYVTKTNALWQIDASPLDAMDTDLARPTIYACIDIATRRTLIYVSKTPRAAAVAMLLRKCILAWGVPDTIKTDNGSDFVAEATKRLLNALDIELELSSPYSPQQKGHVERVIRTFQHNFAEQLPGYVGHNITDRKQIEDRQSFAKRLGAETADVFGVSMTMGQIQERADAWVENHYQHAPHAGLKGRTPFEAARNAGVAVRTVDPRALDVLLMPVAGTNGYRKVTKFGVRVDGFFYQTFVALPKDRVFVRMEPTDLGAAYIFDADNGAFIEPAICAELAGIDPVEYTKVAKRARAKMLSDKTRDISAEIRALTSGPAMIDLYNQVKMREAAAKTKNVIELPKREISHATPEIDAALHAATGIETERNDELALEFQPEKQNVVSLNPTISNPSERPRFKTDTQMASWLLANPEKLTEHDRTFLKGRLQNWTFKELLLGENVDAEALAELIKPQLKEANK